MLFSRLLVPFSLVALLTSFGPINPGGNQPRLCTPPKYWDRGICVTPITQQTADMNAPVRFTTNITFYAPDLMEAQFHDRGWPEDQFLDGIALMSCADIGRWVWLKPPGQTWWEGPYLSIDCSSKEHMYVSIVHRETGLEVGFQTALRWGMVSLDKSTHKYVVNTWKEKQVEVFVANEKYPYLSANLPKPVNYTIWWFTKATFIQ